MEKRVLVAPASKPPVSLLKTGGALASPVVRPVGILMCEPDTLVYKAVKNKFKHPMQDLIPQTIAAVDNNEFRFRNLLKFAIGEPNWQGAYDVAVNSHFQQMIGRGTKLLLECIEHRVPLTAMATMDFIQRMIRCRYEIIVVLPGGFEFTARVPVPENSLSLATQLQCYQTVRALYNMAATHNAKLEFVRRESIDPFAKDATRALVPTPTNPKLDFLKEMSNEKIVRLFNENYAPEPYKSPPWDGT